MYIYVIINKQLWFATRRTVKQISLNVYFRCLETRNRFQAVNSHVTAIARVGDNAKTRQIFVNISAIWKFVYCIMLYPETDTGQY